jgi:hypothetical protein
VGESHYEPALERTAAMAVPGTPPLPVGVWVATTVAKREPEGAYRCASASWMLSKPSHTSRYAAAVPVTERRLRQPAQLALTRVEAGD